MASVEAAVEAAERTVALAREKLECMLRCCALFVGGFSIVFACVENRIKVAKLKKNKSVEKMNK